jgi:hypothetical protein
LYSLILPLHHAETAFFFAALQRIWKNQRARRSFGIRLICETLAAAFTRIPNTLLWPLYFGRETFLKYRIKRCDWMTPNKQKTSSTYLSAGMNASNLPQMIKGVRVGGMGKALSYLDKLTLPIIENTPHEEDLKDSMALVRRILPR